MFCESGDITSGFVAIKNGIEYCYFDMLSLVFIFAITLAIVIIIMGGDKNENKD